MKRSPLLLVLWWATVWTSTSTVRVNAQIQLNAAVADSLSARWYTQGRWEELLGLAQQYHPDFEWANWHRRIGIAAAQSGRLATAMRHLERALQLNRGDWPAAQYLAYSYLLAQRYNDLPTAFRHYAPVARRQSGFLPRPINVAFAEALWRQSTLPDTIPHQALTTIDVIQQVGWRWRITQSLSWLGQPTAALAFRQWDYYIRADWTPRTGWSVSLAPHLLAFRGQPATDSPDTLRQQAYVLTGALRYSIGSSTAHLWATRALVQHQLRTQQWDTLVWQVGLRLQSGLTWRHYRLHFTIEPQWYRMGPNDKFPVRFSIQAQPLMGRWSILAEAHYLNEVTNFSEQLGYIFNNNPLPAIANAKVQVQYRIHPRLAIYTLTQSEWKQRNTQTFAYYSFIIGTTIQL